VRFLRTLDVGDRFKPAHPRQVSLNNRKMERTATYRVSKVYPMSPYTSIALDENNPNDGFYSLGPGTPVLLPMEIFPSEEEIRDFIGAKKKTRVVAYKLLWDGRSTLSGIIPPQAIAALQLMFAFGRTEYDAHYLVKLFEQHYERFWGRPVKRHPYYIMLFYRRYMVSHGLIEEVVDDAPLPESAREANLQEVL